MQPRQQLEKKRAELLEELERVNDDLSKKKLGHEQTGVAGCCEILSQLTVEPRSARVIHDLLNGKYGLKVIRWVMRRYNIRRNDLKPYKYYLSDEKVSGE